MARKTKEDAEKTRLRILASALSLFVRQGYEHTTFTDIAARLKMTKGAVYWHFASKEALLMALVEQMLEKFARQMDEIMPKGGLTFTAVAKMMIEDAHLVVSDARSRAFFLLMKTQIHWGDASMARVREDLLTNKTCGPYHAFCAAVEADKLAGRARADVDSGEVAAVCLALWDGLVQSKIDGFMEQDLEMTLTHAYDSTWEAIRVPTQEKNA